MTNFRMLTATVTISFGVFFATPADNVEGSQAVAREAQQTSIQDGDGDSFAIDVGEFVLPSEIDLPGNFYLPPPRMSVPSPSTWVWRCPYRKFHRAHF